MILGKKYKVIELHPADGWQRYFLNRVGTCICVGHNDWHHLQFEEPYKLLSPEEEESLPSERERLSQCWFAESSLTEVGVIHCTCDKCKG